MSATEASLRGLLGLSALGYTLSSTIWGWTLFGPRGRAVGVARLLAVFGWLAHTATLALAWVHLGHPPLLGGTLALHFFVWALVASFGLVDRLLRVDSLGAFFLPWMACASISLLVVPSPIAPSTLAAEVHLPSIAAHVALVFFGYAFFTLACLASTLFLAQDRALKRKRIGPYFRALPSLDELDLLHARAMSTGFALHSAGIALGLLYAVQTGSTRVFRDPASLGAFALWGLFCLLIGLRWLGRQRGRRLATWTLAGMGLLLVGIVLARSGQRHGERLARPSEIASEERP